MYGTWKNKTDPQHHPVRFLAALWEERLKDNPRASGAFTAKQYGQLKQFRDTVGDLAQYVVEWVLKPENWWRFSQQVRTEAKLFRVPDSPDVGFLLKHRNRALRIMRCEVRSSTAPNDIQFCATIDQRRIGQWRSLLLVYAAGDLGLTTRIKAATGVEELERLFHELVDEGL